MKSKLKQELEFLAENIQRANRGIGEMDQLMQILEMRVAAVEAAARMGLMFRFTSEELRDELRRLATSMERCSQMLRAAEPAARGITGKKVLAELYRQIP